MRLAALPLFSLVTGTLIAGTLVAGTLGSGAAYAQDVATGKSVYMANCMACHGESGDGKGPAAAALNPPPKPFTDAAFWEGKTDDSLKSLIKSGKPGTAMMPFAQLSDSDLNNLVAFLKTFKP